MATTLKGILPKVYACPNLDQASLGGLIDLIGDIALGDEASKSKDILGRVYEYFLGEFALAEGKKGGQFFTPKSIVQTIIEIRIFGQLGKFVKLVRTRRS